MTFSAGNSNHNLTFLEVRNKNFAGISKFIVNIEILDKDFQNFECRFNSSVKDKNI
jgi:hypothetical protein